MITDQNVQNYFILSEDIVIFLGLTLLQSFDDHFLLTSDGKSYEN